MWVQSFALLLICGIVYIAVKRKFQLEIKRKEAAARLRTKISIDLHDDVGSLLSGVALQSELLTYGEEGDKKESLQEISALSRVAMEKMRDIVWAIDSRKDRYENLIDRMRSFAQRSLAAKSIDLEFRVEGINSSNRINAESRQNFYLLFKEAITNIVKHSDASKVNVEFFKEGHNLILDIRDNGRYNSPIKSDGLGLINMKTRAEALGGKLLIDHNNGFQVKVTTKIQS